MSQRYWNAMIVLNFLQETKKRNPLLFFSAFVNLVLALTMMLVMMFDHRTVDQVNTWIKPIKFTLSFFIFLLTFAWLLHYLPDPRKRKILSWGFFICMVMEVLTIGSQAARGVKSHFNVSSPYDGIVFMIMGIFIFLNTLLTIYTIILFFRKTNLNNRAYVIAWRAGLLIFFLGAISGGMMVQHHGHTYGAADGSAGWPFVNWSTEAGDMRVAHFLTLHALQIIPLFAYAVRKKEQQKTLTAAFVLFYAVICIGLHMMALKEIPLPSL